MSAKCRLNRRLLGKKSLNTTPVVHGRNKLFKKLWEQIQLAQAHLAGKQFTTTRFQTVRHEDGVRRSVEVPKRVRAWWWNSDNGIQVKQAIADVVHKRATCGYRRV